jgi:hypothetical protein
MTFETNKWLENFKQQLNKLKNNWEIKKDISAEKLFFAVKNLQEKIKSITKENISKLKSSINKNDKYEINPNYDLAEKLRNKNPKLYEKITSPKWINQQLISAWFWIANSFYKIWIWIKTLWSDLFKLITFQVPIKQIKEQFKRV